MFDNVARIWYNDSRMKKYKYRSTKQYKRKRNKKRNKVATMGNLIKYALLPMDVPTPDYLRHVKTIKRNNKSYKVVEAL